MISRLNYLKDTRGIGLFTAPTGMGKTYALRCFAKDLNPNLYQVIYTCLSTVSILEFYRQFTNDWNVPFYIKITANFGSYRLQLNWRFLIVKFK